MFSTLVAGVAAVSLFTTGIQDAFAAGGRSGQTAINASAVAQPTGDVQTNAKRPAAMRANPVVGGGAPEGGGELVSIFMTPPWPPGTGFAIFSDEGTLQTMDDVIFNEPTPVVAIHIAYVGTPNFNADPDDPGSDFFLRIWEDDGSGVTAIDPPVFVSGPHNPLDGTFTSVNIDTEGFGADSALEAQFNFQGEFFVFSAGVKYWIGMTATPSANEDRFGVLQSWTPPQSGEPMIQGPAGGPYDPVDVGTPAELIDMGLSLLAFAPNGGTTVATFSGGNSPCTLRVTPTTAPITDCEGGSCPTDTVFGADCFAEATLPPNFSAEFIAQVIALDFNDGAGCDTGAGGVLTVTSAGPRLIVSATDGTKPKLCITINGAPVGIIGGPNDCNVLGCGNLNMQVGANVDEVLPSITAGRDNFNTPKEDCDDAAGDDGTWVELSVSGSLFDRAGLGAAADIDQRVRMTGVSRDFSETNTDSEVNRNDDIDFSGCSGDFSRPGGDPQAFAPDGVVDAADVAAFVACNGTTDPFPGDCELLDYNGDDIVDADDSAVLDCLVAAGNSSECCPGNLNFPQDADGLVSSEIRRLHLRGCDYLSVSRADQNWDESWVVDYYLSGSDPSIGANEVGVCEAGDTEGALGNDVIANFDDLGILAEGAPRQVAGVIGNRQDCDFAPFWPGDQDADVYRFTLAFGSSLALGVDSLNNVDCNCAAGQNAVTSLWLFDSNGNLIASDDQVGLADPSINVNLGAGVYFAMVASAGQIQDPAPNGVIGAETCAISFAPEIDGGGTDPTGCYDLNLAVAPSSTLAVRQEDNAGGSLTSRLLVQPLITYTRLCDPFHAILIDTGSLGLDAFVLEATGPWVKSLGEGSDIVPGDANFIPGVADNGGSPTVVGLQHVDVINNPPLAAHRVVPPTNAKCQTLLDTCVAIQSPDPIQSNPAVGGIFDAEDDQFFPVADSFSVAANTEIASVSFWVTPADVVGPDHVFRVRVLGTMDDDAGEVCDAGLPNVDNIITEGTSGAPFVTTSNIDDFDRVSLNFATPFTAEANTTYWLELALDDVSPGAQLFFSLSNDGDGSFLQDIAPVFLGEGDDCAIDDPLNGNGYDCDVTTDDPLTLECVEPDDADGDRIVQKMGASDLAFCLNSERLEIPTKDLPSDVACGNWRVEDGEIVWTQPFAVRGDGFSGTFSDFAFGTAGGNQAADSFTFFDAGTVDTLVWRGTYGTTSPAADVDDFTIEIWSDGNNVPDGLLTFYSPSNADVTRISGEVSGDPGAHVFEYTYKLNPPLAVGANETIWISVINNTAGETFNWAWSFAQGGNSDGVAAFRAGIDDNPAWGAEPDAATPPTDYSFEVRVAGSNKVICGDSVDSTNLGTTASGLGYRVDRTLATINGFQSKSGDPTFNGNRWRGVGAPWKMYDEVDGAGVSMMEIENLFDTIGGISAAEADALRENVPMGSTVESVFSAVAAYDTDPTTNGISVTGRLQRLCNGALSQDVDPTVALSQKLNFKGVCFTGGSATILAQATAPVPPQIVHANGFDGETTPPSGYIDPALESDNSVDLNLGLASVSIRFSEAVVTCGGADIDGSAFSIAETGGGAAPTITGATYLGGDPSYVEVTWNRPITLREWTTITASNVCAEDDGAAVLSNGNEGPGVDETDRVDLGFLPCNVDQMGTCGPFDLLRFRQYVNGQVVPPGPLTLFIDINRNLASDPFDLLRFRQIVNGVFPSTQPWGNVGMNNTQP